MNANAAARSPHVEATFASSELAHAMSLAKRALGPEALILSSRRVERPGLPPRFEVRAALGTTDDVLAQPPPATRSADDRPSEVLPRVVTLLERVLRDNDVPAPLARELALVEERPAKSLAELRVHVVRMLRSRIGFGDRTANARLVAFAGPTGAGKTTTIAKLAARDALVLRRRVAMISMDDYRIGGADQLARFAELMDVPFAVASDAASLDAALQRFSMVDRIYVDTAGRSPKDTVAVSEMARVLSATGAAVSLCIPASTRSREITRVLEQHAPLKPKAVVLTKLDECELFGGAILSAIATEAPLSHFATGQRVPEDVEVATAERLASLLLGEEVVR